MRLTGRSEIRIAWKALSTVLSIFTIPLTLYLVKLILNLNLQLGFTPILEKILTFYFLPVLLGFLEHDFWPGARVAITKILKRISNSAQLLLILRVIIIAIPMLIKQSLTSILVILGFVVCAILIGHLLGGPPAELRPTLAAALASRWVAPALILARLNHSTREIAPIFLTYLIGGALLMKLYGRWVWRSKPSSRDSRYTASIPWFPGGCNRMPLSRLTVAAPARGLKNRIRCGFKYQALFKIQKVAVRKNRLLQLARLGIRKPFAAARRKA